MPDVEEVFRLATHKVRPDPGFVDRQHHHRRRQERKRRIGAFAVVAVIGAVVAALVVRSAPDERQNQPAAATPASVGPVGPDEGPPSRTVSRIVDGVPLSLRVPKGGWSASPIERLPDASGFRGGHLGMSKSTVGPQGAEAIVFWTSFPDGARADLCANLLSPSVGPSAADLVSALAMAPGTDLVDGPSDVTVGGHLAKYVVLTVRQDVGCDPGYFYAWDSKCFGPCWVKTNVGDTIRIWVVDVDGVRLFIEAETTEQAGSGLEQEIQQIVGSIRFE